MFPVIILVMISIMDIYLGGGVYDPILILSIICHQLWLSKVSHFASKLRTLEIHTCIIRACSNEYFTHTLCLFICVYI